MVRGRETLLFLILFLAVNFAALHPGLGVVEARAQPPERVGFTVGHEGVDGTGRQATAVITYGGPIAYPMAANLDEILGELEAETTRVIIDLDSDGGSLQEAEAVAKLLADARSKFEIDTRVGQGRKCLSSCVLVFMQGKRRIAGTASVWVFHGACGFASNIPKPMATGRFVDLLRVAGVSPAFLDTLACQGAFTEPGRYWTSGYQLVHVHAAGIITELLADWQPEPPVMPPFDPNVRAR